MQQKNAAVEFINDEISHLPQGGQNYFDEDVEEPDVFQKIRAFCETGGASGTLGLYRAVPNSKKENFIVDIEAIDFSPGFIKDRFGGGDYIIKAYDDRSKIRLKQHLSIEGDPIIQSTRSTGLNVIHASGPQPQLDIPALMTAMQESNRQLLQGLMQAMQPQQTHSRADMLAELAQMREIFGAPQQHNTVDPMTMLIKGIELAGSMAPKAGGETSGMDVLLESIKSFAPAIGAVVAQNAAKAPAQNRAHTPQVQRQIGVSTDTVPPQTTQTESENDMLMKMYLAQLVSYAKANKDPSLYADLIADNLSDEQIMSILSRPNVIEYLAGINPEVRDTELWFESLILELKIIMGLTEPVSSHTVSVPIIDLKPENAPGNNQQLA